MRPVQRNILRSVLLSMTLGVIATYGLAAMMVENNSRLGPPRVDATFAGGAGHRWNIIFLPGSTIGRDAFNLRMSATAPPSASGTA